MQDIAERTPKTGKRVSDDDLFVAARIRDARKMRGVSQTVVGEALGGVTFQQVQKYERGQNRVSAGNLARLARLFDLPITYFFPPLKGDGVNVEAELLQGRIDEAMANIEAAKEARKG